MRAVTAAPPAPSQSRTELRTMLSHAASVWIGQAAVMAFGVVDTVVAGRHSDLSLAALAVGSAVFITVYVSLFGLLSALLPIWAELHGARRPADLGRSVRQALYVCALASVLGMALLLHAGALLRLARVPPELQPVAASYLAVVGWSLPAALLFRAFSNLCQSLGKPQLVSWLQVVSLFVKVPLSVWLTFGGAGVPGLGVVGCAWGTFIVNYVLLGLALWLLRKQSLFAPLDLWQRLERPHAPTLAAFARLGLPAALTVLVEITSFTLMALFVARLGTTATAAHQIAANVTALLYMTPLSLAIATSARVSYWRGAGDEARARKVALQGSALALVLAALASLGVLALRPGIAAIYTAHAGVALLATRLLAWVALLHVADAVQTLAIFVLRCYRVTLAPFVAYGVLLWGFGLGGGYVLAYRGLGAWPAQQSPAAFWQAAAGALLVTALLVQAMLRRVSRRAVALQAG